MFYKKAELNYLKCFKVNFTNSENIYVYKVNQQTDLKFKK